MLTAVLVCEQPRRGDDLIQQRCGSQSRSVYSEPIIHVYGSGDATLIVNDTFVELEGIENSIILNSVIQEAYQGETLLSEKIEGDFPVLKPGNNLISWSGDITAPSKNRQPRSRHDAGCGCPCLVLLRPDMFTSSALAYRRIA